MSIRNFTNCKYGKVNVRRREKAGPHPSKRFHAGAGRQHHPGAVQRTAEFVEPRLAGCRFGAVRLRHGGGGNRALHLEDVDPITFLPEFPRRLDHHLGALGRVFLIAGAAALGAKGIQQRFQQEGDVVSAAFATHLLDQGTLVSLDVLGRVRSPPEHELYPIRAGPLDFLHRPPRVREGFPAACRFLTVPLFVGEEHPCAVTGRAANG